MSDGLPPDFCPYKGLQPYTQEDRAFFFGRERDREIIISNLYAAPLTILYGASGVGKSSVLMAGVVPQLSNTPRLAVVVFRNWQSEDFLLTLKHEVLQAVSQSVGKPVKVDVSLPLDELIEQCIQVLRGPIFFIFDQFEEYFLYHPSSEDKNQFDVEFARAVNREEVDANFLFALREDGLSKLDRFQGRIQNLLNNILRLDHLDLASANDAIRKPLDEYSRQAGNGQPPMGIEDELVEALLKEVRAGKVALDQTRSLQVSSRVRDAVSERGIETPFLQMVLTRLWSEERAGGSRLLRLSTLKRLGGPANIARTHLDRQMEKLSDSERSLAARLFRYLVTPSGAKIAQEPAALASWAEVKEEQVQSILNKLSSDMRILRTVSAPGQPVRYEVFHDVLAQAIMDWQTRRRLARERLRVKRLGVGLIALLIIMISLVIFGIQWSARVRDQQQTIRAEKVAASALAEKANPELSVLLAMEAVKIKLTQQTKDALKTVLSSPMRAIIRDHAGPVRSASFSPNGKFIVTASEDTTAIIWDIDRRAEVRRLRHPTVHVMAAAFSPDGRFVLTGGRDGLVRRWGFDLGKDPTAILGNDPVKLPGHTEAIRDINFSPDGSLMVTASEDKTSRVWQRVGDNWETIRVLGGPEGHTNYVQTAVFSHDGKLIVTASRDKTVKIWKVGTWELAQTLDDESVVRSAVFSPDDQLIITGNEKFQTKIWKRAGDHWQNDPIQTLKGQNGYIDDVKFSPDGRFMVTVSRDHSALIRNTSTWQKEATLIGHKQEIYHVAYSPDGKYIVTTSEDGTVILWEPLSNGSELSDSIAELLEIARNRVILELSKEERQRYQLDPLPSPSAQLASK